MHKISLLLLFFSSFIYGQLSNKHWLPPLHARDVSTVNDHYLYISTPNPTPFAVTITTGDGNPIAGSPFTISQGNPQSINIGNGQPSNMFLELNDVNVVRSDKGFILTGSEDFYTTFKVRSSFHAELLVSKGIPGIGTSFRLGSLPQTSGGGVRNFVSSFMATEDNTTVTVSDYDTNIVFASGLGDIIDDFQTFILDEGESVVLSGYSNFDANLSGFVGALLTSDKPIAVSTGNALGGMLTQSDGQDFNLDQIVPVEQVGSEYIVVRGNGSNNSELPLVIATDDNTEVFVNGNTTPIAILSAGDYFLIPSTNYQGVNHRNMYITSSKPIYLYQIIAGSTSDATTGLNFIPPLSCFFQRSVDLIPFIDSIGNNNYSTDILVLTYAGSTVKINGVVTTSSPEIVQGNTSWVTYRISGYNGNVAVESTGPLAVGVFGTDNNAVGFSGYYSGFGSEPRDTDAIICSNSPVNLLDEIDGNPETGGIWTPPLASGTDIFDPAIDLAGVYNYSYSGNCDVVDVDITVTIEQAPFAGNDASIIFCTNDAPLNLFSLLGTNVTLSGIWSPAMASGTGVFNPAIDVSGDYVYTIPGNDVCENIFATVSVTNNATPIINTISDFEICDDAIDGNDANGFATFNLALKNSEIIGTQTGMTVSYHPTQQAAIDNTNPLVNYYSNTQLVYIRLTNANNCFAVSSFNLIVNPLPVANLIVNLKQCDINTDAITNFNLTEANNIISTDTDVSFSYHTSQSDANNNIAPIPNTSNYMSPNNGVVWARIINSNGCTRVSRVNLIVSTTQIPNGFISTIEACDIYRNAIDIENDGFDYFNFSSTTNTILALFPTNQNLIVSYYENENDALAEQNQITNTTNYRNTISNSQIIWVRIDSGLNNDCIGLGPYLNLIVQPIPEIDLGDDFVLCINPLTGFGSQIINATPNVSGNYNYNWSPANPSLDAFGNQSAMYNVTQGGTYSVIVKNNITDCEVSDSINVTFSSEPESVSAVLITPFFSPGLASIEAIPVGGYGTYEYSLDGIQWQSDPVFYGLTNGTYIIQVRDEEECNVLFTQEIETVTYPIFFTPNGDGINEYWNISGLKSSYDSKIYIFDRYGKLLKELYTNFEGWDGTFMGQPLPATDYWFKVEYTENDVRKEFKSHFTLKR